VILVDYTCPDCGRVAERWTVSPPPSNAACAACGGVARRVWSPVGLRRGAQRSGPPADQTAGGAAKGAPRPGPPLCSQFPQVPGLCHMSPSAGRMWVARYRRDNRAVDAELARQESRSRQRVLTMTDAITHDHYAPASGSPDDSGSPARRS
jgi:hypothetical protein